jgi:Acetyltransferase (GNAT) domain
MVKSKRLSTLVNKAKGLRERHQERHRPTGYGFALADSVAFLNTTRWDQVTQHDSLFFSRRYLHVLENAGPENLRQRYALIFRGRDAVAAVAAQLVTVSVSRLTKSAKSEAGKKSKRDGGSQENGLLRRKIGSLKAGVEDIKHKTAQPLDRFEGKVLVCGNLLSWGMHGVSFVPGEDPVSLWPAVAEAIYRLRRADKLSGDTDFVMIKDITDPYAKAAEALSTFSYRPLETEPNMVLQISPKWRRYDDYLASLTSKYRKVSKQIDKDVAEAGCTVERLDDVESNAERLHELYLQTHRNARLRLVTLRPTFLPTLAAQLGKDMLTTVVKQDGELLGFVTTVKDRETAVGYYIGFDRKANAQFPIYFRLLQSVVDDAIIFGSQKLSLGRTALEPKARLGARPDPMRIWVRHRIPMLNMLVRALLHTLSDHDEAPERNPFKE